MTRRSPVSLPKAHLHLHLEGSARPETIAALAAREGLTIPPPVFANLPEFIECYRAILESDELLARLAGEGIACDVCPTSNLRLGVVSDLAAHQLPIMVEAGVPVTLNSDDQLFFGSKVAEEYALARDRFGLSDAELADIARTSARVSGAPRHVVTRIEQGIDGWLGAG